MMGHAIGVASAAEETGTVRGVVRNQEAANEPVEGARVQVVGTELEATSAADGTYRLNNVPAGNQTLEVTREGMARLRVPVVVTAGETSEAPVFLTPSAVENIVVFGKQRTGTIIDVRQKLRTTTSAGVAKSKEEMKIGPASNAAQVAKELPGVTAVDNKFVYVRGLGDRYSQTLLNGANVPSPEPDKRVIPLDLFPANLLDSIVIAKTYSPDLPGEFSGGSVQINTVDVPERAFATTGVDVKYRHRTTFQDFKTYHGGNWDKFTFDDGTRALPDEVPSERVVEGPGALTPDQVTDIGRSYPNIWNPDITTAPLDHKLSLSFGDSFFGKKGAGSLGITGALNWANRYQSLEEERRIVINEGSRENPVPRVFSDFDIASSTREAELSGLLNLAYEANEGQKVGVRTMYTRTNEDEVREQVGVDGAQAANPLVSVTRLRYVERSLLAVQPFGEHLLGADWLLEWRGGYALSQRDEPDNRQVRYVLDPATDKFILQFVSGSGRRDYYQLDENIYDAAADLSIPFNPLDIPDKNTDLSRKAPEQRIKIGPAFVHRDRDFDARRFLFETSGGGVPVDTTGVPIDLTLDPESIFKEGNINPNGLVLREETRRTDNYEAEQTILGGYGLMDFRLHRNVRALAGARVENSRQEVVTSPLFGLGDEIETVLDTTDVLPAASLLWEFWQSKPETPAAGAAGGTDAAPAAPAVVEPAEPPQTMQLRLAGSQTVSRPEFRELAPFEYNDVLGGYVAVGNPNLQRAKIINADLAWEWYPSPSEIFSAGIFYKHFTDPIEVINLPTSGTLLTTWQNADSADLYGFEIEGRKNLGMFKPELRDLSLLANLAIMQSEVRIQDSASSLQTNDKRPLQGQPDYVLNLGIIYDIPADSRNLPVTDWTLAILANTFGERISAVGASGVDDEKEQPRWSLDVSLTKRFGKFAVKVTGENLLDDNYEFKQGDITTREYRRGWAVGIGLSYSW